MENLKGFYLESFFLRHLARIGNSAHPHLGDNYLSLKIDCCDHQKALERKRGRSNALHRLRATPD